MANLLKEHRATVNAQLHGLAEDWIEWFLHADAKSTNGYG
jgi:hypothetical protein